MNFCIFGAGSWGTAMSIYLHRAGHTVTLVPRRMEHAAEIATSRENAAYLPDAKLHPDIQIAGEPAPPLMEADIVVVACPSKAVRSLAQQLRAALASARGPQLIVSLVKGLEAGTLLRPSQVLADELPGRAVGVLSGPTNAQEVVKKLPTAAVLATADSALGALAQKAFNTPALRVYRGSDIAGVELGGVLKNIYAIGAGISDGLGLGENAKAAYLSRAIREMLRLGVATGGREETFLGLSGIGDLIATAHGTWSRNRAYGEAIAKGMLPADYLAAQRSVVEGHRATGCFLEFAKKHGIYAPVLEALAAVLFDGKRPAEGVEMLMQRLLKPE